MMSVRSIDARAILLVLASGCATDVILGTKDGHPSTPLAEIEVEPRSIDFGTHQSADRPVQTVTITNVGVATLGVDELVFAGASAFEIVADELPWDLGPEETHTFDVAFHVEEGGATEGQVVVKSNADDEPEVTVDLAAFGAIPKLVITPDPMDLGDVFIPCSTQDTFTFVNKGPEPVVIDSVVLGGADASLLSLPFPVPDALKLRRNEPYEVPIRFEADRPLVVDAELIVESNDPNSPHHVPITGNAMYARSVHESWTVPEVLPVEFVFAVDKSCSMADDATRLANNVSSFVSALDAASIDWRIGVTTGQADGCFTGGVITSATPSWETVFTNAVNVGYGGPYTEALVEAAARSLWWNGATPTCNQALRGPDGTPIHVVLISDEWDQSGMPPSQVTGQPQWRSWLDLYYRAYAGPNSTLRIHSIVDTSANRVGCDGTSNPDDGPGDYLSIASATGGYGLDLCSANWASALASIASQAVADASLYAIQDSSVRRGGVMPADGSLVVSFDGVPQSAGWTLSPDSRSILFDPVPPAGTVVDIDFGIAYPCP